MTLLAVALLAVVLVVAVTRPRGLPEAAAAVPAAVIVLVAGLLTPGQALAEVRDLAPTVGFLAAVLVLAHLADAEGVFAWAGGLLGTRARGEPRRLFALVFVVATVTTAVLSLDATVVLLTPVVLATARRLGVRRDPPAHVCTHLANAASLLLPVANLTNLLALHAAGLSFLSFAGLMLLPQLAVLVVEYVGLRWVFRRPLAEPAEPHPGEDDDPPFPTVAVAVLALTLIGFAVTSPLGVEPVWVAVGGAVVLAIRSLVGRRTSARRLVVAASPLFCAFVLALGVVVAAVTTHGLGPLVASAIPGGTSFPALLASAALAAVLANVVNNLPATLLLLAALGPTPGAAPVLAVLIGVNVGPNLTYVGSLATLLWRQVMTRDGLSVGLGRFTLLGLVTVPAGIVAGVGALWLVT